MTANASRYSLVAIWLHWIIAALLIANIFVGGAMDEAQGAARGVWFMRHETLGVLVLALTLARIGWRLGHAPPAMPEKMAAWERLVARGLHAFFYLALIAIPLLGWASASAGRGVAPLFGAIPFFELPVGKSEDLHETLGEAHETLVRVTVVLTFLHVFAALKHHVFDKDDVLVRMLPFLRRASQQQP